MSTPSRSSIVWSGFESLDKQVESLAQSDRYRSAVAALRCMRGIDTLTAITLLTEIFEFGRFDSPRALMAYLGVTPSEDSSGESRRPGAITKTGNRRVRRILTEAAWHYRHPYAVSKTLKLRRKDQPAWAVDLADRAAKRLYRRYRHLTERGKALACGDHGRGAGAGRLRVGDASAIAAAGVESCPEIEEGFADSPAVRTKDERSRLSLCRIPAGDWQAQAGRA